MFLGSQIARKVPWSWVPVSPGLCWEHPTPASEFPRGSRAAAPGQGAQPVLSAPSRSCLPWILLVACLVQEVIPAGWVSSLGRGFPKEPRAEALWLLSLAMLCHPARPVPFPSAFQGFQLCSTAVAGGNVGNEAPLDVSTSGVSSCEVLSVRYKWQGFNYVALGCVQYLHPHGFRLSYSVGLEAGQIQSSHSLRLFLHLSFYCCLVASGHEDIFLLYVCV